MKSISETIIKNVFSLLSLLLSKSFLSFSFFCLANKACIYPSIYIKKFYTHINHLFIHLIDTNCLIMNLYLLLISSKFNLSLSSRRCLKSSYLFFRYGSLFRLIKGVLLFLVFVFFCTLFHFSNVSLKPIERKKT